MLMASDHSEFSSHRDDGGAGVCSFIDDDEDGDVTIDLDVLLNILEGNDPGLSLESQKLSSATLQNVPSPSVEPAPPNVDRKNTTSKRKWKDSQGSTRNTGVAKKREPNPPFSSRMSILALYEGIKSLTPEQREAVQDTGFGHFVNLGMKSLCYDLGSWLATNFDWCSCQLILSDNRRLDVTEDDVHNILGFAVGGSHITDEPVNAQSDEFIEWKLKWNAEFKSKTPNTRDIILKWPTMGTTDMFKTSFVCAVVSACISGKNNFECNHKILPLIMNPTNASRLNWCGYTIDKLIEAVRKYQDKSATYHYLCGSLLFLNLFYFDKTTVMGHDDHVGYPVISKWNTDLYKERLNRERSIGGFGLGRIANTKGRGSVPVLRQSQMMTMSMYATDNQDGGEFNLQYMTLLKDNVVMVDVHNRELNEQVTNENVEKSQNGPLVGEMNLEGNKMYEKLKMRMESITQAYMDEIFMKIDEKTKKLYETINTLEDLKEAVSRERRIQKFERAYVLCEKDKLRRWEEQLLNEERCLAVDMERMKKQRTELAEAEILMEEETKKLKVVQQKRFAESLDELIEQKMIFIAEKFIFEQRSRADARDIIFKTVSLNEEMNTTDSSSIGVTKSDAISYSDDGGPITYVSPYSNKQVDANAALTRTEQLMYRLVISIPPKKKTLYREWGYLLTVEDFASFRKSTMLFNSMLDLQSRMLNLENTNRSLGHPNRFFYSTTVYLCATGLVHNNTEGERDSGERDIVADVTKQLAIEFEDAGYAKKDISEFDMFFIPITAHEHFFVLVVDYKNRVNWLLENLPLSSEDYNILQDKYGKLVHVLIECVSTFVSTTSCDDESQDAKAMSFDLIVPAMSWQSNTNNLDCGVFALRHMETFMGDITNWVTNLTKDNDAQMFLLRKRYLCKFLLHEKNGMRDKLVKKLQDLESHHCT